MSPIIENEETLIIETPERVPLAFALASIGNRFLAVVIDHAIQFSAMFIVFWFFMSISGINDFNKLERSEMLAQMSKWTIALMIIALFLIYSAYFVLFEWLWNGQTPGKRLLKLRVIREDGRPITLWESVARNLLRLFDNAPSFLLPLYSVGLVSIFLNSRDQRIGDLFAGTVVIRERTDEAPTFDETFSNQISDAAFRRVQEPTDFQGDVSGITLSEIEVIETFLRRRWDLSERQRLWMAWRVALPLMYKIKPAYDLNTFTYEGFLEELLHRFHARQRFLN